MRSQYDLIIKSRHIILVADDLVPLPILPTAAAVIIILLLERGVGDAHRRAKAARGASLRLKQILLAVAVHYNRNIIINVMRKI